MLFYSFEFLYLFLPLALTGYFLLGSGPRPQWASAWLVICSIVFYGWWNYSYVALILPSIGFNYAAGMYLRRHRSRWLLGIAIAANLGLIGYFKYAEFFASTANALLQTHFAIGEIVLPLAISFFTFQQIAWLVDNQAGKLDAADRGFTNYCLFVVFFPQLIAGPIVHHSEMMPQFQHRPNRVFNTQHFCAGVAMFIIGLSKKVILADSLAPYANQAFDLGEAGAQLGAVTAWLGATAYALQLYFDFSGYADMAIGLALMFNIALPLNFDSPYKSRSIIDFWRRWHMTLSRFLRDYLYIPLGGSRHGAWRRHLNLFVTMLLGGLWHGAGWTFVAWGALHGSMLIINHAWRQQARWVIPAPLAWLITLLCVIVAWVFFRADSFQGALAMLHAMAGAGSWSFADLTRQATPIAATTGALLLATLLPNSQQLLAGRIAPILTYAPAPQPQPAGITGRLSRLSIQWDEKSLVMLQLLAMASILMLLDTSTTSEFIYFQF